MKSRWGARIPGIVLLLTGLVLASNPELVSDQPVPSETFEAVERRIWWGLLIGAGAMLLFHHRLRPWPATALAIFASAMFGLLVARLIGIALDGSVLAQWLWVAVEAGLLAGSVGWYAKISGKSGN